METAKTEKTEPSNDSELVSEKVTEVIVEKDGEVIAKKVTKLSTEEESEVKIKKTTGVINEKVNEVITQKESELVSKAVLSSVETTDDSSIEVDVKAGFITSYSHIWDFFCKFDTPIFFAVFKNLRNRS